MHLLELPQELFSYIVHFANPGTLRPLCLQEIRNLYRVGFDSCGGTSPYLWVPTEILNPTSFPLIVGAWQLSGRSP